MASLLLSSQHSSGNNEAYKSSLKLCERIVDILSTEPFELENPDRRRTLKLQHLVVSQNRGPKYRPENTIILIMGIPKRIPLILEP